MSRPVWITPGGNLGSFPELEFYSLPLEVNNPTGTPVTFTFLSGQMPPGLQVIRTGKLQGVPVVTDPKPEDEARTYKFTIRASCQSPTVVVDKTFTFTASNIQPPEIYPDDTFLGEYFDGTLISQQLYAREANPAAELIWSIKDGLLPPGVSITTDGLIYGFVRQAESIDTAGRLGYDAQPTQESVPFTNTADVTSPDGSTRLETVEPLGIQQKYQEFPYDYTTARATNKNYTFTVQVFDGAKYDTQTYTVRVVAKGSWTTDNNINTVDDNVITTDADQLYVPIIVTNVTSLPEVRQNSNFSYKFNAIDFYSSSLTWDSNISSLLPNLSIDSNTGWLNGHVDTQTEYKKTYTFYVTATNVSIISTTFVAGGYANTNLIVTSTEGIRPGMTLMTDNNHPMVVTVYPDDNTLEMSTTTTSPLSGILDFDGNLVSIPVNYKLTVLGDVNNRIVWDTPDTIGTLINGAVSELRIDAHSTLFSEDPIGKALTYKLVHGTLPDGSPATGTELVTSNYSLAENEGLGYRPTTVKLPQGLELLSSGHIVGRTTFRHFQLDASTTTIDGGATNFDSIFTFTVQAETVDGTASDTKTFNIKVNNLYSKPYENLYMKALTTIDQRRLYVDILNDDSLFPDSSIYRIDDPNFGKSKELKFLAVPGVAPHKLEDYAVAMAKNFQTKRIDFSAIKTAIATDPDNNYAVKYEVVYVDIVDPFNPTNEDVTLETNLLYGLNKIKNPYLDAIGNSYTILNPNTFDNMESRITSALGYSARGVIPDWMTSVQEDKTVLGFKRAMVLAYTKPGESKKIAWRIKDKGISLGVINFTADRYLLDNALSANYDLVKQVFKPSRETTFDNLVLIDSAPFEDINYAVTQPFASINNQTVTIINNRGGIDRVKSYRHGDRLVFAQQEGFDDQYAQDGWVYYRDLFLGNYSDGVDDVDLSYYDSTGFDSAYTVPGYAEKSSDQQTPKLLAAAATGATTLYVPYVSLTDYLGKTIEANEFIDHNTKILTQVADNSTGTLAWKITIDTPLVGDAAIGETIKIYSFVVVTAVDGYNITVTGLPPAEFDKQGMIENELTGYGIPSGTRLSQLNGNVITTYHINREYPEIRVGDYLGYHVQNQRAGIWEIRIDEDTEIVTLEFIKEMETGAIVKVLDGRSNGHSYMKYNRDVVGTDTVPRYVEVPSQVTVTNGADGRTSFDHGGTRFFDNRDAASAKLALAPLAWQPEVTYPLGSVVEYNGIYWRALVNVTASLQFERTLIWHAGDAVHPRAESLQWERFDLLTVTGDKYLKFPKIGVFN